MKQSLLLLLSFFILTTSCTKDNKDATASSAPIESELKEKIHEYFSALHELKKFNGVIYASQNGAEIIHQAYNLNPNESSTTYVSTNSQFDIHSISKLMAHYLIERFEIEGKLAKDQSIDKFIADFPNGEKITINMLLNHTSGLPRSFENFEGDKINLTPEQIIAYTKKQPLLFELGTGQQYSNVAYEIIYFIIQEISKKSFAQYLYDEVFQPLEMKDSGAHFYTKAQNLKHLAKNHEKNDTMIVQVANILPEDLKTARIFSTATDLNKFLNHLKEEPYASLLKDESDVIEKNGGSDGIRAQIYTNLKYDYNFVLLANYEAIPFQKTVEDFIKVLEGQPYDVPKELNRKSIELATSTLEKYVGTYSFPDMGDLALTFRTKENSLLVFQDGEVIATLKAESENTFFEDPKVPESFEFIDNKKGDFDVLMGFKGIKLKGLKK